MAVKPGTPHPTKKGMVMGKNGRYVAKSTYNKQVKAAQTPAAKPEKGGALAKTTQAKPDNPRRTRAFAKQTAAAQGTQGSGTRVGQPANSKPTSSKPNPYTSGKPNPNAGGGVKPKPKGSGAGAGYASDIQALRQLARKGGPAAAAAIKRLAAMGIRVAPGAAVAGAIAGSAGRPGAAQMSKLGLRPGKSTKSADAPTYSTPLNKQNNSQAGFNKGPNRVRPTTPYYGPGGASSGSGEGQAQQRKPARQNAAPARSGGSGSGSRPARQNSSGPSSRPAAAKPKPKPKPQTSGVGPVASGRTYSVKKTGKSVMQQQADELRAMRKASQERQAADKKKLEASKQKRKYNR